MRQLRGLPFSTGKIFQLITQRKNHLDKLGTRKASPQSSSLIYLKMTYKRKKTSCTPFLATLTRQQHYCSHPDCTTELGIYLQSCSLPLYVLADISQPREDAPGAGSVP